jgi:hypothetical protein
MSFETQTIVVLPTNWRQNINHNRNKEDKESNLISCEVSFLFPKNVEIIGDENAKWPYINGNLTILPGTPTRNNGEPLEEEIGYLTFHKGSKGESQFHKYRPLITAWIYIDKLSYSDLWEKVSHNRCENLLISFEVLGFSKEYDSFTIDAKWNVIDKCKLLIISAEFQYQYAISNDVKKPVSKIKANLKPDLIEKKKETLSKFLLIEKGINFSQYNKIIKEVANNVSNYSDSIGESADEFEQRLLDALAVVSNIRFAVNEDIHQNNLTCNGENETENSAEASNNGKEKSCHTLWFHADIKLSFWKGPESEYSRKILKDELFDCVTRYIQRPWMATGFLEWIMVDALVYDETREFGEAIKQISPKSILGFSWGYFADKGDMGKMMFKRGIYSLIGTIIKFFIFICAPIALAWRSFNRGDEQQAIFGLFAYFGLLFLVNVFNPKRKLKEDAQRNFQLFTKMTDAYSQLHGYPSSAKFIRERLVSVANEGAVWPNPIFVILDYALKRGSDLWIDEDRNKYIE